MPELGHWGHSRFDRGQLIRLRKDYTVWYSSHTKFEAEVGDTDADRRTLRGLVFVPHIFPGHRLEL